MTTYSFHTRRAMLQISGGGVLLGFLGACAAIKSSTSDQLTTDVGLLVTGLAGLSGAIANLPPNVVKVPPATLAQINAAIADLQANAGKVGTALAPNADAVQAVVNDVVALSALATPFYPASPLIAAVVQAALAMVPGLLVFIHGNAPTVANAAAQKYSPDQARDVLQQAPAKLSAASAH
jgi:hypothetical protein